MNDQLTYEHVQRRGIVYVRQSSPQQLANNEESRRLQFAMRERLHSLGWQTVEVIDEMARSAATAGKREGFKRDASVPRRGWGSGRTRAVTVCTQQPRMVSVDRDVRVGGDRVGRH
jgi:hypothetical protein